MTASSDGPGSEAHQSRHGVALIFSAIRKLSAIGRESPCAASIEAAANSFAVNRVVARAPVSLSGSV